MKRRPCSSCGRRRRISGNPRDFCAQLKFSTGVTLKQAGANWVMLVQTPGGEFMPLRQALGTFQCDGTTSGAKLAQVSAAALNKIVAQGKQDQLEAKAGRQMPLIMLKDFLFKLAGSCPACKGRGCATCDQTGVAP